MARLLTLALALTAICAVTALPELDDKSRAILDNHVKVTTAKGDHLKDEVPAEIRGEKFTTENLHKYFSVEKAHMKVVHKETGEEVPVTPEIAAAAVLALQDQPAAADAEVDKNFSPARRMLLQSPEQIDQIITIGKQVWKIVEDNAPVVSVADTAPVSAIPKACESNWLSMAGWQAKNTYEVKWGWVNGFGMTVVDFSFAWTFKAKGSCQGYGSFLRDAGVVYKNLHVAWAYTVEVTGRSFSPYNMGTSTQPVAAMDLEVKMMHSTVLQEDHQTCRVTVQGNGRGHQVSCDANTAGFNLRP